MKKKRRPREETARECAEPKMFGEDASGRKVSLLNDNNSNVPSTLSAATTFQSASSDRPKLPHRCRQSHYAAALSSLHSKASSTPSSSSSISCSPRRSPPTPPLARQDSHSPCCCSLKKQSPMSRHNDFDSPEQYGEYGNRWTNAPYFNPNGSQSANGEDIGTSYPTPLPDQSTLNQSNPMYTQQYMNMGPPYPQQGAFGGYQSLPNSHYQTTNHMPPLLAPQLHPSNDTIIHQMMPPRLPPLSLPSIEPGLASASTTTPSTPVTATSATSPTQGTPTTASSGTTSNLANTLPVRKKYPCPHAKLHNCTDKFTTSGHAARHGKKHTGEKNVVCPHCHKAFTRKDNMKQHERTHGPGHSRYNENTTSTRSSTNSPPTVTVSGTKRHRRRSTRGSSSSNAISKNLSDDFDDEDAYAEKDADGDVEMNFATAPRSTHINPAPTAPILPLGPAARERAIRDQLKQRFTQAAPASQNNADSDVDADGEADDDE